MDSGDCYLIAVKMLLTKRTVEQAQEGFYWDVELKGLGLKVTPTGKKVFIVQSRQGKRLKRWTLGAYPTVTVIEARTEAKKILGRITLGHPVSPVPDVLREPFTSELELFHEEHVKKKLRSSTQGEYRSLLDCHILPFFKGKLVGEVDVGLVRSFHSSLSHKPYRANRALALLSKFFSWRIPPGSSGVNPCLKVEKYRERRRETNLQSMDLLCGPGIHPAIRLLFLTGMRKSEVLSLRWEYVSLDERTIHLPDSKTGPRLIVLGWQSLELLRTLGSCQTGWVFPSRQGHLIGLQKIWKRTLKDLGLPPDLRLHDLRHHYATVAAKYLQIPLVKALLGHKDIKTTMRYVHVGESELTRAAKDVGEQLSKISQSVE